MSGAAEAPGEAGKAAPGAGEDMLARGRRIGGFFRSEPGLVLTVGYVGLTLVGMAYLARFYRSFGINIFDYADAGDFLLAGLRDPWVMLATLAPFPVAWLYFRGVRLLALRRPLLLGTTARYVFLFDRERMHTVIVPVGNVARIGVATPPRRPRGSAG